MKIVNPGSFVVSIMARSERIRDRFSPEAFTLYGLRLISKRIEINAIDQIHESLSVGS